MSNIILTPDVRKLIDILVRNGMKKECCEKCRYYHGLKHNFKKGKGYEESHCCNVLMYLDDSEDGWIQETEPQSMCEMFTERG